MTGWNVLGAALVVAGIVIWRLTRARRWQDTNAAEYRKRKDRRDR